MDRHNIVIIGAGPTGLGAAWRLNERGHTDWVLLESHAFPGGLSASHRDPHGFTWDIGGHVLFSHYEYFDRLMDCVLGDQWVFHERQAWIWIQDRFVPYPFQYNIRHLPGDAQWECVLGLVRLRRQGPPFAHPVRSFKDWILATFGEGIARHFLLPYNAKVWAWPLDQMDYRWTGERVAVVDLDRILENIVEARDDAAWGPNNQFRFPLHGGTGAIWHALAARLPQERIRYNTTVAAIDPQRRIVYAENGDRYEYERLISTMPLDRLVACAGLEHLRPAADKLAHNSVQVFGIGLSGSPPPSLAAKCWMYFPEPQFPFFRATVFSNYSPNNVPDPSRYWSLMAEVSHSAHRPLIAPEDLASQVIEGLRAARLIPGGATVVSRMEYSAPYAYPIPTLERDAALEVIQRDLEQLDIYSRGRFGAWKYEVGNQDHSAMQGVEIADRLLDGTPETTLDNPEKVNKGG